MKRFYKFRQNNPRYCNALLPKSEKTLLTSGILTLLPERSKGCRILIIESGKKWNPKVVSLEQIFRGVMLALEAAMSEPKTQVNTFCFNYKSSLIKQYSPFTIRILKNIKVSEFNILTMIYFFYPFYF